MNVFFGGSKIMNTKVIMSQHQKLTGDRFAAKTERISTVFFAIR
jgi:hypothetical protein